MARNAHVHETDGRALAQRGPVTVGARRQRLVAEVARQLRLRCGFPGGPLVIGVSGGSDSIALLLACIAIRDQRSSQRTLQPIAAHVHHHLRDSADADLEFVAQICRRFHVALHVQHIHPADEPGNLAANARRMRYEAIERVARHVGSSYIAAGHHAEDQLETMLMALCRGAGLEGLSGMAWRRPLSSLGNHADDIYLLRPLLGVRKHDCEAMCTAAGVEWREDPTNADLDQARARIRREIMPILDILWPDACRRASGTADLVTAAAELMDAHVALSFGPPEQRSWSRADLATLPMAVIAAGLRRASINEIGHSTDELGQRHIIPAAEAVVDDDTRPRRFSVAEGLVVMVNSKNVELIRETVE